MKDVDIMESDKFKGKAAEMMTKDYSKLSEQEKYEIKDLLKNPKFHVEQFRRYKKVYPGGSHMLKQYLDPKEMEAALKLFAAQSGHKNIDERGVVEKGKTIPEMQKTTQEGAAKLLGEGLAPSPAGKVIKKTTIIETPSPVN